MPDASILRRQFMVDGQLRARGVTDLRLLGAFLDLPREPFVAREFAPFAYLDRQAPARGAPGRLMLEPATLAKLIQALGVREGERALEVAGGAGYGAALLAGMGADVVLLEADAAALKAADAAIPSGLAVAYVAGDLALGAPRQAPFDAILLSCGFEANLDYLLGQLAAGGRLVGVEVGATASQAMLIEKSASGFSRRALFDAAASVPAAFARGEAFAF